MNTKKTTWRFWLSLVILLVLVPLTVLVFSCFDRKYYLAGLFAMWGILKKAPKGWKDVIILAVFGFFGILLVVGPLLDTSTFFTVATSYDAASVLAVYLAGVPVNCVHGAAVALTMLLFGKPLLERLQRIQIKYGMMEP